MTTTSSSTSRNRTPIARAKPSAEDISHARRNLRSAATALGGFALWLIASWVGPSILPDQGVVPSLVTLGIYSVLTVVVFIALVRTASRVIRSAAARRTIRSLLPLRVLGLVAAVAGLAMFGAYLSRPPLGTALGIGSAGAVLVAGWLAATLVELRQLRRQAS
jgi:hypothetical protein